MNAERIMIFLAALGFASAIATFLKNVGLSLKERMGLGDNVTIQLKNGKAIEILNASIALSEESVGVAINALNKGLVNRIGLEAQLYEKCADYLKRDNSSSAQYAVNTFLAYAKGYMFQLSGPQDNVTIDDFDEFVNGINGVMEQKGISNLKYQYSVFFKECPPKEDEFIISHADRLIFTNERMVITSEGSEPYIQHVILVEDIANYTTAG